MGLQTVFQATSLSLLGIFIKWGGLHPTFFPSTPKRHVLKETASFFLPRNRRFSVDLKNVPKTQTREELICQHPDVCLLFPPFFPSWSCVEETPSTLTSFLFPPKNYLFQQGYPEDLGKENSWIVKNRQPSSCQSEARI